MEQATRGKVAPKEEWIPKSRHSIYPGVSVEPQRRREFQIRKVFSIAVCR
jgi:hypothetical protein